MIPIVDLKRQYKQTGEEIEKAVKNGVVPITLGKRILRTETAGMTAIANTLFYLDM